MFKSRAFTAWLLYFNLALSNAAQGQLNTECHASVAKLRSDIERASKMDETLSGPLRWEALGAIINEMEPVCNSENTGPEVEGLKRFLDLSKTTHDAFSLVKYEGNEQGTFEQITRFTAKAAPMLVPLGAAAGTSILAKMAATAAAAGGVATAAAGGAALPLILILAAAAAVVAVGFILLSTLTATDASLKIEHIQNLFTLDNHRDNVQKLHGQQNLIEDMNDELYDLIVTASAHEPPEYDQSRVNITFDSFRDSKKIISTGMGEVGGMLNRDSTAISDLKTGKSFMNVCEMYADVQMILISHYRLASVVAMLAGRDDLVREYNRYINDTIDDATKHIKFMVEPAESQVLAALMFYPPEHQLINTLMNQLKRVDPFEATHMLATWSTIQIFISTGGGDPNMCIKPGWERYT